MDLDDALRDAVETRLRDKLPEAAALVVEMAKAESIVGPGPEGGATRDSHRWEPVKDLEFRVYADTPQARFQDVGTRPHDIFPKGRASGGKQALFWEGAAHPYGRPKDTPIFGGLPVKHPGSTKHKGWFSEADWQGRSDQAWIEVLRG